MPKRMRQVLQRWKLPLAVLFLMLVGLAVFYFSHHRVEPNIGRAIDRPAKPKLSRPIRENAVRSRHAKKINKKTDRVVRDTEVESFRCVKKSTFDEAAHILRQEVDDNCDGIVDRCEIRELNAYGELVHYEDYRGCGKVPSHCIEYNLNEYGEEFADYLDEDCDGHLDKCHYLKRNDHGDIIEEITDKGCDGVLGEDEYHRCSTFVYDEDGMIINEYEGKCGEDPENCADFEYDLAAGIRREKWDVKCDGTVDFCWVKIYRDGRDEDDYDQFIDKGCNGTWYWCTVQGDNGDGVLKITGHEACAQKYEELVKRKLGKQ